MKRSDDRSKSGTKKRVEKEPEYIDFVVEFRKYRTTVTEKYKNRKGWVPKDETLIVSFIPSTITKIFVKEGEKVKAGQEVIELEAMKMKNLVSSNVAGTVKKIHTKVGDKVPKGMLIVELEK